jgi:hypothetical protein
MQVLPRIGGEDLLAERTRRRWDSRRRRSGVGVRCRRRCRRAALAGEQGEGGEGEGGEERVGVVVRMGSSGVTRARRAGRCRPWGCRRSWCRGRSPDTRRPIACRATRRRSLEVAAGLPAAAGAAGEDEGDALAGVLARESPISLAQTTTELSSICRCRRPRGCRRASGRGRGTARRTSARPATNCWTPATLESSMCEREWWPSAMSSQDGTVGLTVWEHCSEATRVMSQASAVTIMSICEVVMAGKLALSPVARGRGRRAGRSRRRPSGPSRPWRGPRGGRRAWGAPRRRGGCAGRWPRRRAGRRRADGGCAAWSAASSPPMKSPNRRL